MGGALVEGTLTDGARAEVVLTDGACPNIRSYVLRSGRVTKAQRRSLDTAGAYLLPLADTPLDFKSVFGNDGPVTAEIGFGMGSATAEIAAANPHNNYIGIEVFRAGIGRLLWEIGRRGLRNVRIIEGDAAALVPVMIPDGSVSAFHIFFPDPWPKSRHHKRRLVCRPFTALLAAKLVRGGCIRMATDSEDYAAAALSELSLTETLENAYPAFAPRQTWRPPTKFEQKALARGSTVRELVFRKR
jgi:tRNA (guanine-N7-)-methyltransferase